MLERERKGISPVLPCSQPSVGAPAPGQRLAAAPVGRAQEARCAVARRVRCAGAEQRPPAGPLRHSAGTRRPGAES